MLGGTPAASGRLSSAPLQDLRRASEPSWVERRERGRQRGAGREPAHCRQLVRLGPLRFQPGDVRAPLGDLLLEREGDAPLGATS